MSRELTQCDNCEKYVDDSIIRKLKVPAGYLELCNSCYDTESTLRQDTPKQYSLDEPLTIDERVSTKYVGDFAPHKVETDLHNRLQRHVMENHKEYFNQEIEANSKLSIEELRDRILAFAEDYHGAEVAAIRIKTKMHGASTRFNQLLMKLTDTEKKELRESDKRYIPAPLANPLKQKEKRVKLANRAEDDLRKLFPDFTDEQITTMLTGKKV